jgi:hypothetical protein
LLINVGIKKNIVHIRLSVLFSLELFFEAMDIYRQSAGDFLNGGSARGKAATCTGQQKYRTKSHISMRQLESEPWIPVFLLVKIFYAVDRAVTLIGP